MNKKELTKKAQQILKISEKYCEKFNSFQVCDVHIALGILQYIINNKESNESLVNVLNNYLPSESYSTIFSRFKSISWGDINIEEVSSYGFTLGFINLYLSLYKYGLTSIAKNTDENTDVVYEPKITLFLADALIKDGNAIDPILSSLLFGIFSNNVFKSNIVINRVFKSEEIKNEFLEALKESIENSSIKYESRKELDNYKKISDNLINISKEAAFEKEFVDPDVVNKYIESLELEFIKESNSDKSCLLVGPSGCGKTTIIHELARRINNNTIYESMKGYAIYEVNLDSLVAGTKYRGEFEEKVNNIIDTVRKTKKVILYIDELAHALNAGGAEGALSFGNMIKSKMSDGKLIVLACTTTEEYNKLLNEDNAFVRRFNKILIDEVSKEKTKELLIKKAKSSNFYQNKTLSAEMADKIIVTADKYLTDLNNPAKSLSLFKAAFSQSLKYNKDSKEITEEDISAALKTKFNTETFADRAKACFDELNEQVLDQEDAIYKIGETLGMIEHNIIDPQKPLSVLMFFGPSGCGKTESAKIIARKYFGNEDKLIKVDMNNYTTEVDVNKLFGSAPGYTGYDSETFLAKHLREKPNSVVLFDEIEKAHDTVKQALLQMTDEGYFVDNRGNKISLKNCIIIFTTNAGYNSEFGKAHGAGFIKETGQISDVEKAIRREFSPEFLGRINQLIGFKTLSNKIINQLIERNRKFFAEQSGLEVKFNKKDLEGIASEAKIETCGARNIKEVTKRYFYRRYLASSKSAKSKRKEVVENGTRG